MKARTYMDKGYVRVIFRMFAGEVVALFPDLPHNDIGGLITSYSHVGQHSAADLRYVLNHSRPTTLEERLPLRRELMSAPYQYKLVERERWVRLKHER